MEEQQQRAAWERDVARTYEIDTSKDREFLDKVWDDAGTSFEDYEEYDAFVESMWSYYTLAGRQTAAFESNGGLGRRRRNDRGLGDAEVQFDGSSKARLAAFSEYLARIATVERRVMRLRKRICRGLTQTITPEEARKFLEEHSISDNDEVEESLESLWWPDESSDGRTFRVLKDSVAGELQGVAAHLVGRYPWTEYQAAYFILCGGVPQAATVRGGHIANPMAGVAAHKYRRATIKLEVESWVPSELVRKAYSQLQRELHGARNNRRPSDRNVEVFRFVVDQSEIDLVNTGEYLARLKLPTWRQMLESWNKQFSESDPRRYPDVRNFRRDFDRGQQAVIGTEWGLPGVPGQPMSNKEKVTQARAREARLIKGLKALAEKKTGNAASSKD